MKALITGSCGFIGSSIADALLEEGHEVVGIDDLSTGQEANWPRDARLTIGDIRDPFRLFETRSSGKFDVVFHCAASYKDRADWERDASVNVLGTINVVREAQRSEAKLIYFQTSLCYGAEPASPVTLDAPLNPRGSYAVSKTAGERYIFDSGIPFVSLRLANIYGPRNLSGPVPAFFQRLSKGQPCTVVNSRRDFVYIDDLLQVAVKAATQGRGVYHVSSGRDVAIIELYWAIAQAMRIDAPEPEIIPRGPDDVATLLLAPDETFAEFGWTARTPLVYGIGEAVRYYQSRPPERTFTHLQEPSLTRG